MDSIINNWYILVAVVALITGGGFFVYRFAKLPPAEQLKKVKEWLLLAVTEAETALGGGTGKLKLRYVYDLFITKFPWLVKVVSFELFSSLVDDALEEMRDMLKTNAAVKTIVEEGTVK